MLSEVVLQTFQAFPELEDALSQGTPHFRQALSEKEHAEDQNHQDVKGTERPFEKSKSRVHARPLCF
jgi:hypothetical protein